MQQECTKTQFRQGNADISRLCFAIRNDSPHPCRFAGYRAEIGRFDPTDAMALTFLSDWGREMTPVWRKAAGTMITVTSGRACKGAAPWAFIREATGQWHFYALETFGCWQLEMTQDGRVIFSYDEKMLSGEILPGECFELGGAICAADQDYASLCAQVARYLRGALPVSRMNPGTVSWNHWWRYEDAEVTEEIVLENARLAREMGIDLIVLDAGWFGDPDTDADWTKLRGDWEKVNTRRFPHGLAWLADRIHGMGMKFGLWLEPEGMGERSSLRKTHPQWEATRAEGLPQPYLCLGADGAKEWLLDEISRLVQLTKADYLKLDFNVDPGFGCDRSDHGHQSGMGLWAHMKNYTAMLDELREAYPDLIIENCSSGGMRLDLTMMKHTDVSFLSDPDESAHSLQVFLWLSFLPPERLLHWAWSQTREYEDGSHAFPPLAHDALISHMDAAMLHPFGFSRDLVGMTQAQRDAVAERIAFYKREIAPLLADGVIDLKTPPPLRKDRTDDGRCVPFEGASCRCELRSKYGAVQLNQNAAGVKITRINQEES